MEAKQIYQFINAVQSDALGRTAVRVRDTSSIVSLGEIVLSSDVNKEQFYSKLVDRIGATYVSYRKYVADNKNSIVKRPLDFGIILQKIQVKKMGGAKANGSWTAQVNPFAKEYDTTDIMQSLYTSLGTWETETKLIYDYQLKQSFTSAEAMASFVDMIYSDMANSMEFEIEQCIKTTKARLIAEALGSTKPLQHRNLLSEYNTKFNTTLTVAECLTDVDFLKFASREIYLATRRITKMTSLFNSQDADRFTDADNIVLDCLSEYTSSSAVYLDADTYHKSLVELKNFNEIDSWQSSGTDYSFTSVSSINIKNGDDDENPVEQSGIIALLYDKEACGVSTYNLRTKSIYNSFSEVNNVVTKMDYGSYIDRSQNAICFYIAE